MDDKLDELAKAMAQPVARRAALKKFGIGLGVITLTLMTFTPVFGRNGRQTFRSSAKLLPVGDERQASGVVNMTWTHGSTSGSYHGSASCKGLRPNASYELWGINPIIYWHFRSIGVADTQGMVQFGFRGMYGDTGIPAWFEVYRIQPTGNVLVLSGRLQ
jgi:hypothetical protein